MRLGKIIICGVCHGNEAECDNCNGAGVIRIHACPTSCFETKHGGDNCRRFLSKEEISQIEILAFAKGYKA